MGTKIHIQTSSCYLKWSYHSEGALIIHLLAATAKLIRKSVSRKQRTLKKSEHFHFDRWFCIIHSVNKTNCSHCQAHNKVITRSSVWSRKERLPNSSYWTSITEENLYKESKNYLRGSSHIYLDTWESHAFSIRTDYGSGLWHLVHLRGSRKLSQTIYWLRTAYKEA